MKKVFILAMIQISVLSLFSQKDDGLHYIRNAQTITENFKEDLYYSSQKIPFKEIQVIDKRYDTTKIGYTNSTAFKVKLEMPWSDILNNYFKNNFDPSSGKSLVVVIKSFWLQRGVIEKFLKKKIILKDVFSTGDDGGGCCTTDIDVYTKSDNAFQALFKIDTFFINMLKNFRRNTLNQFFFLPFDSLFHKLATIDVGTLLSKRKKITFAELTNYYDGRFNLPILNDSIIRKGIFLTFDDFKKNQPSETNFNFQQGKLTDELYIGNKPNERVVDSYWGFFDGKDLYIRAGYSAFKAIRQSGSFELYGAVSISNYHNNPLPGDIKFNSMGMDKKILQVNMDTGELY
jgi:hypothetical protein